MTIVVRRALTLRSVPLVVVTVSTMSEMSVSEVGRLLRLAADLNLSFLVRLLMEGGSQPGAVAYMQYTTHVMCARILE